MAEANTMAVTARDRAGKGSSCGKTCRTRPRRLRRQGGPVMISVEPRI